MRIVKVVPDFGLGGIQKAGCVMADGLARLGHEVTVVAEADGPRRRAEDQPGLAAHRLAEAGHAAELVADLSPEVVHIHGANYEVPNIAAVLNQPRLAQSTIVVTPVFGRPPEDMGLLNRVKTCCVGLYTFHRLTRWLGMKPQQAVDSGIVYAPMTPFQQPETSVCALDAEAEVLARRQAFGLADARLVIGRIGRSDLSKWDTQLPATIAALLEEFPDLAWLSIGMPDEFGAKRLADSWGDRFVNLPETSDYSLLCRVLSSLDTQLFASRYGECFASSICEPAGLGVPTLALSTPLRDNGQAEQVIDGVTGFLMSGLDALPRHIKWMLDNPAKLQALKQSTRGHARTNWSDQVVSERVEQAYQHWRGDGGSPFPLGESIVSEAKAFREQYPHRVCSLASSNALGYRLCRMKLAATECWPLFRTMRRFKRWLPR